MEILKCSKIHDEGFGLTIFTNTLFDPAIFFERLSWIKEHIKDRDIQIIFFGGEPMVPEFGNHKFTAEWESLFLTIPHILKKKVEVEIYSDLIVEHQSFRNMVDRLKVYDSFVSWKFTPEFYPPTSMSNFVWFMINFKYIYETPYLGNTSYIISSESDAFDKIAYQTISESFPKADIHMQAKPGEEDFFWGKGSLGSLEEAPKSHLVSYGSSSVREVSLPELVTENLNHFKGMFCDTRDHVVLDLSGNLYSCMTGYKNRDLLFSEGTKQEFLSKLNFTKCPYECCLYDDNMSVVR